MIQLLIPIVVLLSILVLLQSLMIAYPLVRRKFRSRPSLLTANDFVSTQSAIVDAAKRMLLSRRVLMSFNDDESLYTVLADLKNRVLGRSAHHVYAYFNFPIAFLLLGLLDHHVASGDEDSLRSVELKCEDLLDHVGNLKFAIDKPDQAVFGLAFLRLYELTQQDRYLAGARRIYEELLRFKRSDGIYRYRLGLDVFFVDAVGLICPFLVRYAEATGIASAMTDAERQVKFALSNCVEPKQGLAVHAFDLVREQPLGSVNWGRGTGWFLFGLSAVASANFDPVVADALRRYRDILERLREPNGYWPQFLGHTDDRQMDSSCTLMFLNAFQQCDPGVVDMIGIQRLVSQCVDSQGLVISSSGDTIYINKYSRVKGPSELSQGLMLSLIARVLR